MNFQRYFITDNVEVFLHDVARSGDSKNIKQMKALLMGLEVLTVHVKGYAGDYHQKQEFRIQSAFFARASSKRVLSHMKSLHKLCS